MDTRIRDYGPLDEQPVVELALRAWAPVVSSLEQVLVARSLFACMASGGNTRRRRFATPSLMTQRGSGSLRLREGSLASSPRSSTQSARLARSGCWPSILMRKVEASAPP